jgi:fucose 4-O-acetylase-like acetyltransferase
MVMDNSEMKNECETKFTRRRVNSVRGIACILITIGHIIGYSEYSGLKLPDDNLYRILYEMILYVRIPLFALIAGYVYEMRPYIGGFDFFAGKIMRLLLPCCVVLTIYVFVQQIAPGVNNPLPLQDIFKAYIYPFKHFWFIQASIFILFFSAFLDRCYLSSNYAVYGLITFFIGLNLIDVKLSNVFSINNALYMFPFFLAGRIVKRGALPYGWKKYACSALFVLVFINIFLWFSDGVFVSKTTALGIAISMVSAVLLFVARVESKILSFVGKYSFTIYLYHGFFIGFTRAFNNYIGVESVEIYILSGLVLSVFGSYVLHRYLMKFKLVSLPFLGVPASPK